LLTLSLCQQGLNRPRILTGDEFAKERFDGPFAMTGSNSNLGGLNARSESLPGDLHRTLSANLDDSAHGHSALPAPPQTGGLASGFSIGSAAASGHPPLHHHPHHQQHVHNIPSGGHPSHMIAPGQQITGNFPSISSTGSSLASIPSTSLSQTNSPSPHLASPNLTEVQANAMGIPDEMFRTLRRASAEYNNDGM
jgi:hypothetical protein